MKRARIRDTGSGIFLWVVGAAIAAFLGYTAYKMFLGSKTESIVNNENVIYDQPVPEGSLPSDTFMDYTTYLQDTEQTQRYPIEYFLNTPQTLSEGTETPSAITQMAVVVQNDENITWTDWLGRERTVSISRKVR